MPPLPLYLFAQSIAQQLFAILAVFSLFSFHVNAQMEDADCCMFATVSELLWHHVQTLHTLSAVYLCNLKKCSYEHAASVY